MDMDDFINVDLEVSLQNGQLAGGTIQRFRDLIYRYYRDYGRALPWRNTRDPYRILVSEFMLQQTQVDRVLRKYGPFTERFPDISALHNAPLDQLLGAWQGLGYNRRCLSLKRSAGIIVNEHAGSVPDTAAELLNLPGIGPATAAGILCFAYGKPVAYLETNIRNVFIHIFFRGKNGVHDREIQPLVEQTLDRMNPREWYFALMDYGAMLKREIGNLNMRSRHYTKQPPFEDSNRQLRGTILKVLLEKPGLSEAQIMNHVKTEPPRVRKIVAMLANEGFIKKCGGTYSISD